MLNSPLDQANPVEKYNCTKRLFCSQPTPEPPCHQADGFKKDTLNYVLKQTLVKEPKKTELK